MAAKYRLTITEQDMENLHQNKESGEATSLFLTPINSDEGLKELQIEVMYGERPVAAVEPDAQPEAQANIAPSIEDEPDATQKELTPGFTGESAIMSFDSFFKVNEKKEDDEDKDKDTDDKGSDDDKEKSDKPKFGSPEWRAMYPPGKKGKKKKTPTKKDKVNEQASKNVPKDNADKVAIQLARAFSGLNTDENLIWETVKKYKSNPKFLKQVETRFNERDVMNRKPQGTLIDQIKADFGMLDGVLRFQVADAFGYDLRNSR